MNDQNERLLYGEKRGCRGECLFLRLDQQRAMSWLLIRKPVHYLHWILNWDPLRRMVTCELGGPGDPILLTDNLDAMLETLDNARFRVLPDPSDCNRLLVSIRAKLPGGLQS